MIKISQKEYQEIASELLERIGYKDYIDINFKVETETWIGYFHASLILYRNEDSYPEGDFNKLSDVVPVWWEFHTVGDDGEVLNDFQFSELKKHLI